MKVTNAQMRRHSLQTASGRLGGPARRRQYLVTIHVTFVIVMIHNIARSAFSFPPALFAFIVALPQVFPVQSANKKEKKKGCVNIKEKTATATTTEKDSFTGNMNITRLTLSNNSP